jgi:hypothetical protein
METQKQPVFINVVAALNVLGGVLLMLAAFAAPTGAEGAIQFGFGTAGLAIGIGLFRLRPWARWTAIGGYALNIITGLIQANFLIVVTAAVILPYLLFSATVKEAFAAQPTAAPAPTGELTKEV